MQLLDEIVNQINKDISKSMSGVVAHGIVRSVVNSGKTINYDEKGNQISFDDKSDVFLYHKSISAPYSELRAPGKTKTYQVNANTEVYVYSKKRNTEDLINTVLSKYKNISITNLNTDSAAIFAKEADAEHFKPEHYVFVISYQIIFKTSDCLKDVCNECNN